MPDSYPFPMYSGLLEPGHYKKIGSAIWLFLWCVSSTTKDVEKEGVVWGIVLGNKPIQLTELAERFDVSDKTVSRWLNALEEHQYIRVTRAPRGIILSVKNSKKYTNHIPDKNVRSQQSDQTDMSDHIPSDQTNMSGHSDKNVRSNKDITDDSVVVVVDEHEQSRLIQEIETHFIQRRGKGFAVSSSDFLEIKQLVAAGVPSLLIKTCIDRAFDEYRPRHSRDEIRSFNFVVPRILDEWEKSKAITAAVPHVAVALGSGNQKTGYKSKQQRELDELERLREEELKREQASGH
ncbi:ArsR family transcriptional regulator [Paenibacillus pinisoli]|uniref:ArsR family transcriptional regulator n=1 Tax=Paenibacillus pinisoli TaxID=1276110 RepID=A0A3A6PVR5_9BACL|nr:winged helix-turn-helix domain-containing protein [Paenibacillus pinisoli]RJX40901.1 ArsR family transcriptional regulator [Paenibacillus pinisoli]